MVPLPNYNFDDIKQVLENTSGYPFELSILRRVENYEKYGYWVQANYSFEDQDTGEARELDFHATKAETVSLQKDEFVFTTILGSCKANKYPCVFFTRDLPLSGYRLNSDIPIAGCPLEIFSTDSDDSEGIHLYFQLHRLLHIAKAQTISSQFCELVWKASKWEVQSEVVFKNTYIPILKVISNEIEERNKSSKPKIGESSPEYTIIYPLIIMKGPIYEYYSPPSGDTILRETNHIVFTRHYESEKVKCYYAVDVIHESYLESYLDMINNELKRFVNLVRRHKKVLVQSIRRLAEIEEKKDKSIGIEQNEEE